MAVSGFVRNVHERILPDVEQAKALIDSLASEGDALWPTAAWPRMAFDRPLAVGAVGGHGPIRYFVESYEPGNSIKFRFTGPKGFHGWHSYEMRPAEQGLLRLRHTLEMTTSGLGVVSIIITLFALFAGVVRHWIHSFPARRGLNKLGGVAGS